MKIINPACMKNIIPWAIWKNSQNNHISLTFDDGPHPEFTTSVLHILDDFDLKATFFLTGKKVIQFPGIIEEIFKYGHSIGNHGYSHTPLIFKKKNYIFQEIDKTSQAIRTIIGETPKLFRPPYGWFDLRFKKIIKQKNLKMVLWSLMSYDFNEISTHNLYQRVIRNIASGDIIVFHDGHNNTPVMLQILPEILTWIKNKKFTVGGIK